LDDVPVGYDCQVFQKSGCALRRDAKKNNTPEKNNFVFIAII
jgi:hypothetical protein